MKFKNFLRSRFNLLINAFIYTLIFVLGKVIIFGFRFEFIPKDMVSLFPSMFTAIIFILGFLLSGVVSDYKESEKIPNDICASLYPIWQEIKHYESKKNDDTSKELLNDFFKLIDEIKSGFLKEDFTEIHIILNNLLFKFISIETEIQPITMSRVKNELNNIKKYCNRVIIIKETDFIPSVFIIIKLIATIFIIVLLFVMADLWWSIMIVSFYSLIIFFIIGLIRDIEDPFEYNFTFDKLDEVSLSIFDKFSSGIDN